jgi:hypothetical protein
MKGLTGEWHDLKDWTAYLIDLLSRGKRDVTALKALIVLALIVIPGGILLQSSGDVFTGASAVLSPVSSLFHGLLSGPAQGTTPDDLTHTGVFDPDFKPTPYVWQGRTDTPSGSPQGNTTPTPTPVPGSSANDTSTPAPTLAPTPNITPTPTNEPTATPGPTESPTPVPTDTPTPTPVPTDMPTPTPTPQDHITVHVHDGSGPIAGATVTIGSQILTTDASGDVVFILGRDSTVNIHVGSTGYDAYASVYIVAGDATVDVPLALTPTPTPTPVPTPVPQDHITVYVHDGSGTPIEGATVTAGGQTASTDASGNALFTFDSGSSVNIHVSAAGFTDNDTPYTTGGDATVDVTMA